ncbi:class I SAM-dependent DNA methyltransferase [Kibdelosporangium lantanae]|uniref:Class I SAM-dependent DNA methyltransferase n=1 Tax=Kibdelosporangium lantanae TaxID=1497396 RepID=A0ABW3MDB4_9PSEU
MTLFGPLHAHYYDQFHRTKDYRSEVDQLRTVFRQAEPVESVIDLGCGTGRHLELLAAEGYSVVGVDSSAAMVAHARARLGHAQVVEADLFEVSFDRRFDAAIMMFSLLGYQVTNARVRSTLEALGRQVRPGGLVLFDVMSAAAVLGDTRPQSGVGTFVDGDRQMLVAHSTVVNPAEQVLELTLRMWEIVDGKVTDQVDERHVIRYFQPLELTLLLDQAGLEYLGSAPLPARPPWARLVWARRR